MTDLTDERLAELEAMAKAADKGVARARALLFGGEALVLTQEERKLSSQFHIHSQTIALSLVAEVRRLREELDESRRLTPYRRGYEDALRGPEVARMTDRLAESQARAAKLEEALRKVRKFDPGACLCAVVADGCMNCILRAALAETEERKR